MSTQSHIEQQQIKTPKMTIKIIQQSYGKASKKRQQEPSMFQILKWKDNCLTKHDFKKNRDFRQFSQAYLGQIEKSQWTSQAKENYVIPNGNIQIDESTSSKVENYIHKKQSSNNKSIIKSNNLHSQDLNINNNSCKNNNKNKHYTNINTHPNNNSNINTTSCINIMKRNSLSVHNKYHLSNKTLQNNERGATPHINHVNNKVLSNKKNAFGYQENEAFQFNQQQQMKRRKNLIQKFKQTTRWIPNSSFTSYFGKPPFENYGSGNTKPTKGGLVYGTYLYSHNVHPHRGTNIPKSLQSYPVALNKAKSQGILIPYPPKTKNPDLNNQKTQGNKPIQKFSGINIYPEPNQIGSLQIQKPNLIDIERFGGNGIEKTSVYKTQSNLINSNNNSNKQTLKRKYKGNISHEKEEVRDVNNYEQWIFLKEEQNKKRPSSAKNCNANGKKVTYNK